MLPMRRRISSKTTGFHKYAAPTFMALSWTGMAIYLFMVPASFPLEFLVLVLIVSTLGAVPIFWLAFKLRHVSIDGQFLYIKQGSIEEKVPMAHIAEVKQTNWIKPFPVTIRLAQYGDNARKIVFIPKMQGLRGSRNHPIVAELNRLKSGRLS